MVKCPNCGAENPDDAYYCGRCAVELRPPPKPIAPSRDPYFVASLSGGREPDSMAAVAINVRRIFILLGITVLLTLGSIWLNAINITWHSIDANRIAYVAWGVFGTIVVAVGLWYAVKRKRITGL